MKNTTLSFDFPTVAGKNVTASFDGGNITSDAGMMLIAMTDKKIGLTEALSNQIIDNRQTKKVRHTILELLRERIYGIASGYEDTNDFKYLRKDPALKVACDRAPQSGQDLASQPTLSRLENSVDSKDIFSMGRELARIVVQQLPRNTKWAILDIDAYEDPCHGQQEFEEFNGYYDSHCYLPLAIFVTPGSGGWPSAPSSCHDQRRLMAALLRSGKAGNSGVLSMIELAVKQLRKRLPHIQIILRADAAFGIESVLNLCHDLKISYSLGLATNQRLQELSCKYQMWACCKYTSHKYLWQQEGVCRVFGRFEYKAGTWSRNEHVVIKAEITQGSLNPRYIVTDLYKTSPEKAYDFYCGRGECENGIKEFKIDLSAGRTSCHRFLANQFRLLLHVAASVLISVIQKAAQGTMFEKAQASTIRLRLFKVGARIQETVRRIWIQMSSSHPNQKAWATIYNALAR